MSRHDTDQRKLCWVIQNTVKNISKLLKDDREETLLPYRHALACAAADSLSLFSVVQYTRKGSRFCPFKKGQKVPSEYSEGFYLRSAVIAALRVGDVVLEKTLCDLEVGIGQATCFFGDPTILGATTAARAGSVQRTLFWIQLRDKNWDYWVDERIRFIAKEAARDVGDWVVAPAIDFYDEWVMLCHGYDRGGSVSFV
ncbi:MAG: hypothetical protein M1820_001724 [Bogoriella megaspora]|nr:MAG: hypothetical protein M1820_001724 [Bogoriella megaspora]